MYFKHNIDTANLIVINEHLANISIIEVCTEPQLPPDGPARSSVLNPKFTLCTVQEVEDQLKNINPTKAREPDDFSPRILILKNVLALAKFFSAPLKRKQLSDTRTCI